jgi:hypothetical protein
MPRQAAQTSDMTPPVAPLRDETRSGAEGTELLARIQRENEELRDENLNLKIDNRAKEQVISLLNRERRDFVGEIKHQATRIGEMTAKLLALGAPAENVDTVKGGDNFEAQPPREGVE